MTVADVVRTRAEAAAREREPLLILEPLEQFLDGAGIGVGPLRDVTVAGAGHSNVTFAMRRGSQRIVVRRPPRGPLPPSAHDVLREARILRALRPAGIPVPAVLASCDDPATIGAPFYVMTFVDGAVLSDELPAAYDRAAARDIGPALVDALADLHALDADSAGLGDLSAGIGAFPDRQLRRFKRLLAQDSTRTVPALEHVAEWLEDNRPVSAETTVVHGDYRLGNVMLAPTPPAEVVAILDWELTTLGDPLADLGYLTAMWARPGDPPDPMLDLSRVTRRPEFVSRDALAQRYAERTGRSLDALPWHQALAIWRAAILLEGGYRRHLAGTTHDPFLATLEAGVPALAQAALSLIKST